MQYKKHLNIFQTAFCYYLFAAFLIIMHAVYDLILIKKLHVTILLLIFYCHTKGPLKVIKIVIITVNSHGTFSYTLIYT